MDINDIVERIKEVTGVTLEEIRKPCKEPNIVQARAILAIEMRSKGYWVKEIAHYIKRHHTTASYLTIHFQVDEILLKKVRTYTKIDMTRQEKLIKAKDITLSLKKKVHLGLIATTTNQDHELINQLNELNEIIYSVIFT